MSYLDQHLADRQKPSGFAEHLINHLQARFGCFQGKSVVDLGCGRGGYALEISRWTTKLLLIDREDSEVRPPLPFYHWDFRTPIEDLHRANTVFSKSVIEHLLDPEAYMRTIRRLLEINGQVVLMVPDWKTCKDVFYDDYTHVRPYTVDSLTDLFRENGFVGTVERFWQVPFAWKHPRLFSVLRHFHWLVRDPDLRYRLKHAAILAVVRRHNDPGYPPHQEFTA